jgi:hypothetical protein
MRRKGGCSRISRVEVDINYSEGAAWSTSRSSYDLINEANGPDEVLSESNTKGIMMETTAYLITKVLVGWPVNWTLIGGLGCCVGSPLFVTTRLAPWKLGVQMPGGLGLSRGERGEAETTPRRERIRAVTLVEETIIICQRIRRLELVVRRNLKG